MTDDAKFLEELHTKRKNIISRIILSIIRFPLSYEFFIAHRYLRVKSKTGFLSIIASISVAGVVVGVAALIIVLAVLNGFENDLKKKILGTNSHIYLLKYHNEGIENYRDLIGYLKKFEHVKSASPFIYTKGMISSDNAVDGIVIRGIDLLDESQTTDLYLNIRYGKYDFDYAKTDSTANYPGVFLGITLAEHLRVHVGEVVTMAYFSERTLRPTGAVPKIKYFRVAGIFDAGMYDYNSSMAYISIETAQKFFNMEDVVTGIAIKIDNMDIADEVADKIVKDLGPPYRANDWKRLNENLFSALKLEKLVMSLILTLIVIVASFNIISTLIVMVIDKTRDIGILKSLGATSGSIMRIFVFEGFVIGIVGTIIGNILGFVVNILLDKYRLIPLPPDVYFIDRLPAKMVATDFIWVSISAITISVLATIYPAWKASRLDPVSAIQYE